MLRVVCFCWCVLFDGFGVVVCCLKSVAGCCWLLFSVACRLWIAVRCVCSWPLCVGCCVLAVVCWLLCVGSCLLFACCCLLCVVCCVLIVGCC